MDLRYPARQFPSQSRLNSIPGRATVPRSHGRSPVPLIFRLRKATGTTSLAITMLFAAGTCLADDFGSIVSKINKNRITLETINTLVLLDGTNQRVGFGLCVTAGHEPRDCDKNGSVGYGMCVAAGTDPDICDRRGSVGYGICVTTGIEPRFCERNGTVGYGMCISAGNDPRSCY